VHFDITRPKRAVEANAGVEKIGTGVCVVRTDVLNFECLTLGAAQVLRIKTPGAPQEVEERFLHVFIGCTLPAKIFQYLSKTGLRELIQQI
jgi:hypothetical protein